MAKTLFISDIQIGASERGGEQMDKVIYDSLDVDFMTCTEFNIKREKRSLYLVSNFASLSANAKDYLKGKRYKIIHNDFLFSQTRNPGIFGGFKVPKDQLINIDFILGAEVNFAQSDFQASIFKLNGFENTYSWNGNLWNEAAIENLVKLESGAKNGKVAIIDDPYKNTEGSIKLAQNLRLSFDLIARLPYDQFIEVLSKYSGFCINVAIPETFNRILIEAKLMNLLTICNAEMCGATYTELYQYNGSELGIKLNEKREEILKLLKE